jgi:pilus assembly protein Flp/PilA
MHALSRFLRSFAADKSGATAIEYGLICALIVVVIIANIAQLGNVTLALYILVASM